jgi:hypothetical protein
LSQSQSRQSGVEAVSSSAARSLTRAPLCMCPFVCCVASRVPCLVFRWHFTIRGPPDSDFQGGRYHGRILLPSEYPFKPPDIVMLTPRYEQTGSYGSSAGLTRCGMPSALADFGPLFVVCDLFPAAALRRTRRFAYRSRRFIRRTGRFVAR